jgi:hypothetical protein
MNSNQKGGPALRKPGRSASAPLTQLREIMKTLQEVLSNINSYSIKYWLYLPDDEKWTLQSRAAVLESEEVPPEREDDPDAGIPAYAKQHNLMEVLPISVIQSIVNYAINQKKEVDLDEIFESLIYYYDNDAYLELTT